MIDAVISGGMLESRRFLLSSSTGASGLRGVGADDMVGGGSGDGRVTTLN